MLIHLPPHFILGSPSQREYDHGTREQWHGHQAWLAIVDMWQEQMTMTRRRQAGRQAIVAMRYMPKAEVPNILSIL